MAVNDLWGVVVGGVIGLAGSVVPYLWQQRRLRLSARALVRAYIAGILSMEAIRQHGDLYQQNLDQLRSGATQSLMKIYGADDTRDELQSTLIGQLAYLEPNVARDTVAFCNMLAGLRIDVKAMVLGQMDNLAVPQKIRILELDLKIWNDTLALGRSLVDRLS
jgi:hypothetical protein